MTALGAPGPPVALVGALLPEDTGHCVAFLRGNAGGGCMQGVEGKAMDQGLEIVGAKHDSAAPLSTFYQAPAVLWHQTDPDSSPTSTMDSERDLGKSQRVSEPQFIHLKNGTIYTQDMGFPGGVSG